MAHPIARASTIVCFAFAAASASAQTIRLQEYRIVELVQPPAPETFRPEAVNDAGIVVGGIDNGDAAFYRPDGTLTVIPRPAGSTNGMLALDVNDSDQILVRDNGLVPGTSTFALRSFVWDARQQVRVPITQPPASNVLPGGVVSYDARKINDIGEVLSITVDNNFQQKELWVGTLGSTTYRRAPITVGGTRQIYDLDLDDSGRVGFWIENDPSIYTWDGTTLVNDPYGTSCPPQWLVSRKMFIQNGGRTFLECASFLYASGLFELFNGSQALIPYPAPSRPSGSVLSVNSPHVDEQGRLALFEQFRDSQGSAWAPGFGKAGQLVHYEALVDDLTNQRPPPAAATVTRSRGGAFVRSTANALTPRASSYVYIPQNRRVLGLQFYPYREDGDPTSRPHDIDEDLSFDIFGGEPGQPWLLYLGTGDLQLIGAQISTGTFDANGRAQVTITSTSIPTSIAGTSLPFAAVTVENPTPQSFEFISSVTRVVRFVP